MDTKLILQLVKNSYTDNELDVKKVESIAGQLSKKHLRLYIKILKKHIAKNTVIVESAFPVSNDTKTEIDRAYAGKSVEYKTNKDLMLGIKIYENDIIFSKNLKDTLDNIKNYINN